MKPCSLLAAMVVVAAVCGGCEPTCHNRCVEHYDWIVGSGYSFTNLGRTIAPEDICTSRHGQAFADIDDGDCRSCEEALMATERLCIGPMCETEECLATCPQYPVCASYVP